MACCSHAVSQLLCEQPQRMLSRCHPTQWECHTACICGQTSANLLHSAHETSAGVKVRGLLMMVASAPQSGPPEPGGEVACHRPSQTSEPAPGSGTGPKRPSCCPLKAHPQSGQRQSAALEHPLFGMRSGCPVLSGFHSSSSCSSSKVTGSSARTFDK